MTCGSVDDGKSTILGNLLYATGNIEKDIYENLDVETKKFRNNSSGIDFSLLLDGLIDEKEQGITIDIAFKYFYINQKKFVFIDSPGHIEFTRNMANAATFADLAIILKLVSFFVFTHIFIFSTILSLLINSLLSKCPHLFLSI